MDVFVSLWRLVGPKRNGSAWGPYPHNSPPLPLPKKRIQKNPPIPWWYLNMLLGVPLSIPRISCAFVHYTKYGYSAFVRGTASVFV